MEVFLNEKSLHGQFSNPYEFQNAITSLIAVIRTLSSFKNCFYKSTSFYYCKGISESNFKTSLKKNHILNQAYSENIDKLNPQYWESEMVHLSDSTYVYNGVNYVSSSIAELAERKFQNASLKGILLNFKNSIFNDKVTLEIIKEGNLCTEIDCTTNVSDLQNWLDQNGFIDHDESYNEKSPFSPSDHQTVLRNSDLFELTSYPLNKGRRVYLRKGTNQLWTVDNSPRHANDKAHIEVFDSNTGKHLGTSLYNKIELNTNKMKKNRSIKLS